TVCAPHLAGPNRLRIEHLFHWVPHLDDALFWITDSEVSAWPVSWPPNQAGGMAGVFDGKASERDLGREIQVRELHAEIGQLVIERDFWPRPPVAGSLSHERRKTMVDKSHPGL